MTRNQAYKQLFDAGLTENMPPAPKKRRRYSIPKPKRFYRKVLAVTHAQTTIAGETIPVTEVLYCSRLSETSTTVKTNLIGYRVYVGNHKCNGVDAWHPDPTSINLKNPLESKFFKKIGEHSVKRTKQDAFNQAWKSYVLSKPELSKNLTGTVRYWSYDEGSIYCQSLGMLFVVHACNIKGARTWYPETACMYLKEKETVTFDLADMGDHFTASKVRGNVYFDEKKWARLDHDKLAFRCDEDGNAVTGLFSLAPASGDPNPL